MKNALPLFAVLLAGCTTAAQKTDVAYPSGFPEALKNDAYVYYGLANEKPTRVEIDEGLGGPPRTGVRTIRLDKVADGKATYILSGGLASEGDITLSLEPDGLYTMASTATKLKPHTLEMPAKLEVGGGWKDHTEMGEDIVLDNEMKIVGKERVSTPGGTFDDALHITSVGQGKMQGNQVTLTTESWYVRNMGAVKQILNITPKTPGAKARTVVVQLAAPAKEGEAKTEAPGMPPALDLPSGTSPSGTPK